MAAMFGWLNDASTCASRVKRARRSGSAANPSGRILMATSRPSLVSVARQTAAIPSPSWLAAAAGGDLPFASERGKRLHVDLRRARFVGDICHPLAVRRELSLALVIVAVHIRERLPVAKQRQDPDVELRLIVRPVVSEVAAIRRPIRREDDGRRVQLEQDFFRAAHVRRALVDIELSSSAGRIDKRAGIRGPDWYVRLLASE